MPVDLTSDHRPLSADASWCRGTFFPVAPCSLAETGLGEELIQTLILKYLARRRVATGAETATALHLPLNVIEPALARLQRDQLLAYQTTAGHNDFVYQILDQGSRRASDRMAESSYLGPAPVPLDEYATAIRRQSIRRQNLTLAHLRSGYCGLTASDQLLSRLGQAIRAGKALFLHGAPGNGKTTLAERISACFGQSIWIPYAVEIDGDIVRLFDRKLHCETIQTDGEPTPPHDRRWVRIERPSIVVGGELTMSNLDLLVRADGLIEAPLQLKSNGGTLVIDDFGRQKMRPDELLNRWIIPLEKDVDILNLPGGRTFHVPFDQMLVFATNLAPRDLVDEAFLRRIPYKLTVADPTETQFRELLLELARQHGLQVAAGAVDFLLDRYYKQTGRPLRFCQPRDLVRQVDIYCAFHNLPGELNEKTIDAAAENYFSLL